MAEKGGCQDLRIGQLLNVIKAFRNTAIITIDNKPHEGPLAFYVVPTIDLAPASGPPPEPMRPPIPQRRFGREDAISKTIFAGLIGQDEDAFIKVHPKGECSNSKPDVERCVYQAIDREDCPVAFECSNAIYDFHHGRMASFQTSLSREEDWKAAYRLAQKHYPVAKRARTISGESIFFETGRGILGFGRTFVQTDGLSPVWEISFCPSASGTEIQ